nr:immunoglobulin light chain junction region [Macaca mulatta]MOW16604.1 immunoglobulin light chain junction region [Macaca mulatta]
DYYCAIWHSSGDYIF